MGTRGNIIIKEQGKELCRIYKQYDSYPDALGVILKEFLSNKTIVNGFGQDVENKFNGMACLSASLIKHLKEGIGGVYMDFTDNCNIHGDAIDYSYVIEQIEEKIKITIYRFNTKLISDFIDNIDMLKLEGTN